MIGYDMMRRDIVRVFAYRDFRNSRHESQFLIERTECDRNHRIRGILLAVNPSSHGIPVSRFKIIYPEVNWLDYDLFADSQTATGEHRLSNLFQFLLK